MIIELTNDKINKKASKDIKELYKEFFIKNKNIWFKGHIIESIVKKSSVRTYVNKLRCEGMPIISSSQGYKLTTDKNEIKQCYEELRLRALKAYTAAKRMQKNIIA